MSHPEIKFTSSLCNGCGECVPVCPTDAIRLDKESGIDRIRIDRKLCTNCGKCIESCFTDALEYFGKRMTVDEVFSIVKKDEQFYSKSKGGVTIGGGEPTLQPHFTYALIRKCKENYIHTAVDTCCYTQNGDGVKVLEEADLLLCDLKGMDPDQHRNHTGVRNKPILKNLKRLSSLGKRIIIRLPIIPGYTDSPQNIKSTAEFLSTLKSVERVDLLTYHAYGTVKYEQLGREYGVNIQPISKERVDDIKAEFERYGAKVQLGG